MRHHKPRKIRYIPGIISLLVLPFAFISFAKSEIGRSEVYATIIFFADERLLDREDFAFPWFHGRVPEKRNYHDIVITGNQGQDEVSIAEAQQRVRRILKTGDTLNGVHFLFGKAARFGQFVDVLNTLQSEEAKTYAASGDQLWLYTMPLDTAVQTFGYQCFLCNDVINVERPVSFWETLRTKAGLLWRTSWPFMVLYGGLVTGVLFLRKKRLS